MDNDKPKLEDDDEIIMVPDLDEETKETPDSEEPIEESSATAEQLDEEGQQQASETVQKEIITEKVIVKKSKDKTYKDPKAKQGKDNKDTNEASISEVGEKPEGRFKKLWHKYLAKKKITIPVTIVAVFALLVAIPFTRYTILGLFIKQAVNVTVLDSKTGKPVSEAEVSVAGLSGKTDGSGQIKISGIKVGPKEVKVTKKYYQEATAEVLIPITKTATTEFKLQATGRQVPLTITNSIDGKPLQNVLITSGESSASTDTKGQATLVLSPESEKETANLSLNGYNNKEVEVVVTDNQIKDNEFTITPAGKVYFLSKKSGKIDVVKTNLDGTDRQTVLAGTGKEDEYSTVLLASRDWKYLALLSKRDGQEKLFLINTSNDKLSVIDEGDAGFSPVGWYDQNFIFTVSRNNVQYWQSDKQAIKSFNAENNQLKTIDETKAEGTSDIDYASEQLGQIYILENELVFYKTWTADYYSGGKIIGKKNTVNSVKPDGSSKKVVAEFDAKPKGNSYMSSKLYKPQEVYFQVTEYTQNRFYEYEDGKLTEDPKVNLDEFNSYYPTYLISPSDTKTFWHEPRDGKNTLFIGDKNADDTREIATLSEYQPYGWFTDEYILESKNGSELYIASPYMSDKLSKISDYHKPNTSFYGYGYGYGGL